MPNSALVSDVCAAALCAYFGASQRGRWWPVRFKKRFMSRSISVPSNRLGVMEAARSGTRGRYLIAITLPAAP
jgi:hypothetical protein